MLVGRRCSAGLGAPSPQPRASSAASPDSNMAREKSWSSAWQRAISRRASMRLMGIGHPWRAVGG